MAALSYFGYTRPDALAAAMDSGTTTVSLVDGASFPDPAAPGIGQYTVILAYGTDREEVCTVTAKPTAGILTVTRAQDGTLGTAKNQGDVVVHGVSARDFTGTVKEGDPRLSDARVPTAHATTHSVGGTDVITPAAIGAPTSADVTAQVAAAVPTGAVMAWVSMVAPTGWHLCNGTAHGSAALTALLTSAGVANPTLTPDLRNRFLVGVGSGGGEGPPPAIGRTGGADAVTLTGSQSGVPAHDHGGMTASIDFQHTHDTNPAAFTTASGGEHVHSVRTNATTGAAGSNHLAPQAALGPTIASEGAHTHVVDVPAGTTGSVTGFPGPAPVAYPIPSQEPLDAAGSHENRPPFYTISWIVKK